MDSKLGIGTPPATVPATADQIYLRLNAQNSPLTGPLAINPTLNNVDIFSLTRSTDTLPTGNFVNFKALSGTTLFKVDILGNSTANTSTSTVATGTAPGRHRKLGER